MGIFEPITHKEEIDRLLSDAQDKYDTAKKEFENQKKKTTDSLKSLGKVKVKAWSEEMEAFLNSFGTFKNVEVKRIIDTNIDFVGYDEEPKQILTNMQNASMNATEVAKAGFAAVGTGALVGVAAYGGAMMFGTASTGTAIAALSGAAKTNATLAWFGGGAKALGGLGMAAGKLVLTGIVVAPIIGVATLIAGAKGKEKLAEAKKIHAEAEDAVAKMHIMTTGMNGIEKMSDNYSKFIKRFGRIFAPFIKELERIKSNYGVNNNGSIEFDSLSQVEQKTLHLSWLMAQIYYHMLATPILTADGEVSPEAKEALKASNMDLKEVYKETFTMVGEDATIGNIMWRPKANFMLIISFVFIVIFLIAGIMSFGTSVIKGLIMILASIIACPIFFKFRDIPSSRLCIFRPLRLIVALAVFVLAVAYL